MPIFILNSKNGPPSPKKRRRTQFFLLIVFISAVLFAPLLIHKRYSTYKIINSLSLEEKQELKAFFYDLFARNELGYTLFGDKPMSFCWPATLSPRFSQKTYTFKLYVEGTRPLFRGLKAWEKVIPKGGNNYSLIICKDNQYPSFTILINKVYFEKEFNKNIDLFRKFYGNDITAALILRDLEKKTDCNEIFKSTLFKNNILLGIMLGYGRHNGELFQRREELIENEINPPFLTYKTPSERFSSIEKEIEYLWEHLQPVNKTHEYLLRVVDVGFAGDPDDAETHLLVEKYEALHKKLIAIFDREDWLEIVLRKLLQK